MLNGKPMASGNLEFVVFGPGRSGTTAFSHGFNCHPEVFCAIEYLGIREEHASFRIPDDFLERPDDRPMAEISRALLRSKLDSGDVKVYGNKFPHYYFRLDALRASIPRLKLFYIYRSPSEFVHSWDRRASDRTVWHVGKKGIFGAIEQIYCLKRLASIDPPATMVSYRWLFYGDPNVMSRIISTLDIDPGRFDQRAFEARYFRRGDREFVPSPFYDEFLAAYSFDLIDDYFRQNPVSLSNDPAFRAAVEEQFARLPGPRIFAEFVRRLGTDAEAFVKLWARLCRNCVDNPDEPANQWLARFAMLARRHAAAAPTEAGKVQQA